MVKSFQISMISVIVTIFLTSCILIESSTNTPAYCAKEPSSISALEKELLEETNLARTNPKIYATFIEQKFLENPRFFPVEGREVLNEAISFLNSIKPRQPLKLAGCLCLAAQDHIKDIGQKGIAQHEGTDGSTPKTRAERYTFSLIDAGENIAYGQSTPRNAVIGWIVNDGVPNRGHRKNIFRADYQYIGIAVGSHTRYKTMYIQEFSLQTITNAQEISIK